MTFNEGDFHVLSKRSRFYVGDHLFFFLLKLASTSRSYLPCVIESFISDNVALELGRDVRHDGTARKSEMVLAIDQPNAGSGPVFRFILLIRFPTPLPDGPARVLNLTKGVYG